MREKIYNFINSRDIRDYLREKEYPFDSLQCAYLVWQSKRHTLAEKHAAWQEVIDTMPDMPVPHSSWYAGWDSLHGMLRDYMAMQDKYLAFFQENEPNAVFTYTWQEDGDWIDEQSLYTQGLGTCFARAQQDCTEYGDRFRIKKQYFDHPDRPWYIWVEYDKNGEVLDIHISIFPKMDEADMVGPFCSQSEFDLRIESFEEMWFDIPIPFQKGDIVCSCFGGDPFVLESTVPWYRREHGINRTDGEITDMLASGVGYNADTYSLADTECPCYLDLEYYRGELTKGDKLLEAYSRHIRGKLDVLRLLEFQRLYRAEAEQRQLSWLVEEQAYILKTQGKEN